jgi:hypothetical protein
MNVALLRGLGISMIRGRRLYARARLDKDIATMLRVVEESRMFEPKRKPTRKKRSVRVAQLKMKA